MDRSGAVIVFVLRASESFAKERGVHHKAYYLRRGGVAFLCDNDQLAAGSIREADRVEVRLRGSPGDQGRKRAILVRTIYGLGGGEEGGAGGLLVELFRVYNDGE